MRSQRRSKSAGLFGLWLFTAASVMPHAAKAQDDEAARLREIERQMQENEAAAAALLNKAEQATEELERIRLRLVRISENLQDSEARATAIEQQIARLANEEVQVRGDLTAQRRSISTILAALQSLERSRPPALAVSPDDATDAAVAAIALSATVPELKTKVDDLQDKLSRLEALEAAQVEEQARLVETEESLAARRRLLADALAEREAARAQDEARLRQIERENRRLAQEATSIRELIAGIAARAQAAPSVADAGAIVELPGGPEIYSRLPSRFSAARSQLPFPTAGRIDVAFGARLDTGDRSEEMAFATRAGAVVTAPFRGEVKFAREVGRLGNVVILDVGEGYYLVLRGMGTIDVQEDQRVRAGEPIGRMSGAGGERLRFQIRRGNVPVDPADWLLPVSNISSRG